MGLGEMKNWAPFLNIPLPFPPFPFPPPFGIPNIPPLPDFFPNLLQDDKFPPPCDLLKNQIKEGEEK